MFCVVFDLVVLVCTLNSKQERVHLDAPNSMAFASSAPINRKQSISPEEVAHARAQLEEALSDFLQQ